MREIRFRAYHIKEKVMCGVSIINFDKGAFLIGVQKGKDEYINGGKQIVIAPEDGRFCDWDEFELMQFTGLKDKNGVEIYEGDIIKHDDPNWGYGGKYDKENDSYLYHDITFEDGCFCLRDNLELHIHNKMSEVIGNIYENPELI